MRDRVRNNPVKHARCRQIYLRVNVLLAQSFMRLLAEQRAAAVVGMVIVLAIVRTTCQAMHQFTIFQS